MSMLGVERSVFAGGVAPINATGAAQVGDYVCMKFHRKLTIIIMTGTWAGGTSAVTVKQATSAAAGSEKALSFAWYWLGATAATNGDKPVKTAVVSDTFNLTAAGKIAIIEIDAGDLDVNNLFCYVRVDIGTPGANADYVSVLYELHHGRYAGAPDNMPSVLA